MDLYEKLEFDKLIKELDFVDSDLVYKSNVIKKADEDFMKNVNSVLDQYPQLKIILDDRNKQRLEVISQPIMTEQVSPIQEITVTENKPTKLKNLYRQIAKSTHPDKTKQENLNEVYLDAQKAYESNNMIQILTICDKLRIDFEISNDEIELIRDEIETKKQRIMFLESTYTWRWYVEQSMDTKIKIILKYLETQLVK
jgi:hypothetical protein